MDPILPLKPLTKDGVAEVFGISTRTVETWVNEGLLPAPATIGHRVFWHPGVFYRWLNERLTVVSTDEGHPEGAGSPISFMPKRKSASKMAGEQLRSRNLKRLDALKGSDAKPSNPI